MYNNLDLSLLRLHREPNKKPSHAQREGYPKFSTKVFRGRIVDMATRGVLPYSWVVPSDVCMLIRSYRYRSTNMPTIEKSLFCNEPIGNTPI
jgi:hypothetical protein